MIMIFLEGSFEGIKILSKGKFCMRHYTKLAACFLQCAYSRGEGRNKIERGQGVIFPLFPVSIVLNAKAFANLNKPSAYNSDIIPKTMEEEKPPIHLI
jgi:hypothetical protein